MVLIQLSRASCPPCQTLKKIMEKEQKINSNINYIYVDIDDPNDATEELLAISRDKGVRSLPILFLAKEDDSYELVNSTVLKDSTTFSKFLFETFGDSSLAEIDE